MLLCLPQSEPCSMKAFFLPLHYSYVYYFLYSVCPSVSVIPLCMSLLMHWSSVVCTLQKLFPFRYRNSHFVSWVIASLTGWQTQRLIRGHIFTHLMYFVNWVLLKVEGNLYKNMVCLEPNKTFSVGIKYLCWYWKPYRHKVTLPWDKKHSWTWQQKCIDLL